MQTTSRIARSILPLPLGSKSVSREGDKSEALVSMISRRSHKRNRGHAGARQATHPWPAVRRERQVTISSSPLNHKYESRTYKPIL
jgi:hypothetical protein